MDPGHCPAIVFVWPTFLLSHSLSPAPSIPGNNTHCQGREKKRRARSIWAGLNHEAQKRPGDWKPAFWEKDHSPHVVSGLLADHFLKQVMSTSELNSHPAHSRYIWSYMKSKLLEQVAPELSDNTLYPVNSQETSRELSGMQLPFCDHDLKNRCNLTEKKSYPLCLPSAPSTIHELAELLSETVPITAT
ncbi:uncharacterized protein LOC116587697 isoform X2 [Mustela erminea]|uniref:uncharacterized protein LOC116587697 isoform X2 n=1 Tax=Mustela erminea TaxID=36723 RepID=UPI00138671DC|nr:uncharacterized protein LOC116587697 isoform X2 [Mustela erminea]